MYSDCYNFEKQPNTFSFLQPVSEPVQIEDFCLEPLELSPSPSHHSMSSTQEEVDTYAIEQENDLDSSEIEEGKRSYRDFKLGKKYVPYKISSVLGLGMKNRGSNMESRPIKRIKIL